VNPVKIKNLSNILFQMIDWDNIEKTVYSGETGTSSWKTLQFDKLRVRMVEYSVGYLADHWCTKGHIVHCLNGEFVSELQNGDSFRLTEGMTYIVSDEMSIHRSHTATGVKLLIIDGAFLKPV
jgi:hypothetical protein